MFKRTILTAVVASLVFAIAPADAKAIKRRNVTFSADPCHVTCPYWFYANALPDPTTFDLTNVNPDAIDPALIDPPAIAPGLFDAGDAALGTQDVIFTPDNAWCADNGVADYAQKRIKAPKRAELLVFEAWPEVDWDIAICRVNKKGKLRFVEYSANSIDPDKIQNEGDACAIAGFACPEKITISVKPGTRYVLRAYNWGDPNDLPARFTFFTL